MLCGDLNEKEIQKGGYMYTYSWFTLLCSRNEHNIAKQQYSNLKKNKVFLTPLPKFFFLGLFILSLNVCLTHITLQAWVLW